MSALTPQEVVQQARNLPAASTAAEAKDANSGRAATCFLCSELAVGQAAQNPADQSHLYTKLSSMNHLPQHTTSQIIIQNWSVQHSPFTKWDTDRCQGLRYVANWLHGPISVRTVHLCRHLPCVTPLPAGWGDPPVPSALPARLGAECPPHPHLAGANPQNTCVQHRLLSLATSCQETDPAHWWLSIPIEVLYILSLPLLYNLFLQFSLPLVLCKTMHLNDNTDNISSSDKGTEISSSDVTTFL